MILRRYGKSIVSVAPNFNSRAMTEISFTRTGETAVPADEFEAGHERVAGHVLTARAAGEIQGEVEDHVLSELQHQLEALEREAGNGTVLLIENQPGMDQAKTRGVQTTKVVAGANRMHFEYSIDPPLKVGVYAKLRSDG
ncbi:MAG: hypothetical protein ACREM1_24270 [Longimicrobiales bacterium]